MRPHGTQLLSLLWLGSALPACNCDRAGQSQLESKDSTPSVAPNPLDFGDVPLGQVKTLPLTLTNAGALELEISSVTLGQAGDGGPVQFAFPPSTNHRTPFGTSLPPGASAMGYLQCQPGRGGPQTGSLVIESNSEAIPTLTVPLACDGIDVNIVVQPVSLAFGDVQVGTQGSLSVTLTNTGTSASGPIQVSPVAGTQAAEFSWTGTPAALAPGQSFSLQVAFAPKQQGPASALIPFSDCSTCSPQSISLSGTGVDGQLVYAPSPIVFSNVPAGSSSTSPPVTLTNVGLVAVSIQSFAMQSGSSTPFSLSGTPSLPIVLQPDGGSFQFTVGYTASAAGNDADSVDAIWVPLDSTGKPVSGISPRTALDPVTGDGSLNACSLQIAPGALSFGTVTVGTAVQQTATLENVGGQPCDVTAIAFGAGTDPAYSLVSPGAGSLTIPPGQSGTVTVSCDVASNGNPLLHKGLLAFQSNDPTQANGSVPLSATIQGKGPYSGGWPKWHNDNTDQGQSAADTSSNNGTVLWKFSVGAPQTSSSPWGAESPNPTYMNSPVVDAAGNVYQLGMDGTFYAISPTGSQLWTANLLPPNPDEHPATPIIAADGTIYVESGTDNPNVSAQLYHLDSTTGKILFQAGPPTGTNCDTTPDCQSDYDCGWPGTCNGGYCCWNADGFDVNPSLGNDGELFDGDDFGQIVTYTLNPGGTFTQASDVIVSNFEGERVSVALDANDNSFWCCLNLCFGISAPSAGFTQLPAWPASGAPVGNLLNADYNNSDAQADLAYDASFTGWLMVEAGTQTGSTGQVEVVAMDPANGTLHWDVLLPAGPTPGAFNPNTEEGIFSADVGNSSPAIDAVDGTVYVGNVNGLYALVGQTGAIKAGFPYLPTQDSGASADVDSAPAIGGDRTVFFGTAGGTFYAVAPGGNERYHYSTGGRISSSPAIGPDGTVFFVSDDGYLYAIR